MNGNVSDSIWEDIINALRNAYERSKDGDVQRAGENVDIIQSAMVGKRSCKPSGGTIPG